jgi:cytochrome c-type biogenesis protein CcmE
MPTTRLMNAACRTGCAAVLLLALAWPSSPADAAGRLELADLIAHADQYDKQVVTVVGRVTNLQLASNKQGQLAYGFLLKDGDEAVRVFALGKAEIREGDQVVVEGVFSRQRLAGRAATHNEIKASSIRSLERFSPDFVG